MLALPDANSVPLASLPPSPSKREEPLPLAPLVTTEFTTKQVGISGDRLAVDGRIEFRGSEAALERRSLALLQQVAALLKNHPELAHVEVRAHTGGALADEQARSLSQQRAETVVKFLVGQGVEAARLTATGAGATQPIAPNLTAQGRKKNERVEFLLGK
jgi:outer membrane protein OmpA-like peptidoglycan-associated protein